MERILASAAAAAATVLASSWDDEGWPPSSTAPIPVLAQSVVTSGITAGRGGGVHARLALAC